MGRNFLWHIRRPVMYYYLLINFSDVIMTVFTRRAGNQTFVRTDFITTEVGFRRSWWLRAGVSWNGKNRHFFSSTLKRLKSTRRLTLTFWRRPYCQNAAVCIQTMILSSCKTALHHTAPKQLKIFFETIRPISLAHKNGHHSRQIWIR